LVPIDRGKAGPAHRQLGRYLLQRSRAAAFNCAHLRGGVVDVGVSMLQDRDIPVFADGGKQGLVGFRRNDR
jgi:hypothetical protein